MTINPVNLLAQKSYTNNGNKYIKSNCAKTALTLSAAVIAINSCSKVAKSVDNLKGDKTAALIACSIYATLAAFGLGTAVDGIINKINSKIVDKEALIKTSIDRH